MATYSKLEDTKRQVKEISRHIRVNEFVETSFILDQDNSVFVLRNSIMKQTEQLIIVFTEHQGDYVFDKEDLAYYYAGKECRKYDDIPFIDLTDKEQFKK